MSDTEHGPVTPEQEAELYSVRPYQQTFEELKKDYDRKFFLKWILYKNNHNIKIWSYSILNPVDHQKVDRENGGGGLYGTVQKDTGFIFDDPGEHSDIEKKAIRIAINKFLSE